MLPIPFKILEKDEILFKLQRIKGRYYSHRNICYDFCIAGQEIFLLLKHHASRQTHTHSQLFLTFGDPSKRGEWQGRIQNLFCRGGGGGGGGVGARF